MMLLEQLDHGIRCDEHVGDVRPPRCTACDAEAAAEARRRSEAQRIGECPRHSGYPTSERFPCEACKRDTASSAGV